MSFLSSLTGRLFRLVFGWYLALAISVTATQLALEYSSITKTINADIQALGQSFAPGIEDALWALDRPLLASMIKGIMNTAIVTGARITTPRGEVIVEKGAIPIGDYDRGGSLLAPYRRHQVALQLRTARGETRHLGELTIFSDRSVALSRIKNSFFTIVINSLIKTVGLWLIFYLVLTKSMALPIRQLTAVVSQLEFAAESKDLPLSDYPYYGDELGRLLGAMRKMQERLSAAHAELEQANRTLEQTVVERTQHLSEALDFSETILLNSPTPMGVYRADGQCVLANEALAQIVGATREALLAQNYHGIATWKQSGLLEDALAAVMHQHSRQREVQFVSSFGKEVWLDCRFLPTQIRGEKHLLAQFTDITERKRAAAALEESNRKLEVQSNTDGLTGISNRRHFDAVLAQEHARHARSGAELSLILLDLDHFKAFNDTYGHVKGDECLRQVARVMAKSARRPADLAARYGGEEFACILPETSRNGAAAIAEEIRQGIIALAIPHAGSSVAEHVTASLGVVTVRCAVGGSVEDIVAQVDKLLYKAKASGRNQIQSA